VDDLDRAAAHHPHVLDRPGADTLPGLRAWRDLLVKHQRTLECRGGCPIGTLGAEVAEIDDAARLAVARGFARWEARIRDGLRAMHARGDLPAGADPDDLALATLAALQGGLLLAQVQRDTRPLGLPRAIPPERLLPALRTALIAPDIGGLWRIRGVRLVATDLGSSAGAGPKARGTAEALLMTIAGRRDVTSEVSGPGQRKFAGRLHG
jgi:Tetracyclin repressor-like, C-terminal domain